MEFLLGWLFLLGLVGLAVYWASQKVSDHKAGEAFFQQQKAEMADLYQGRTNPNPPTPQESKDAHNHLRVANSYYRESFTKTKDGHEQISYLSRAMEELLRARKLDPSVTLTTPEDGTETQDQMAAKFLFYESHMNYQHADTLFEQAERLPMDSSTIDASQRLIKKSKEYRQKALDPGEKAVRYAPNNVHYLQHLVRVYDALGNKAAAKQTLDRALSIDPDNIESLKLRRR